MVLSQGASTERALQVARFPASSCWLGDDESPTAPRRRPTLRANPRAHLSCPFRMPRRLLWRSFHVTRSCCTISCYP